MTTGREGKRYPMPRATYKTAPTRQGGGRFTYAVWPAQSSVSVSCTPPTSAEQML